MDIDKIRKQVLALMAFKDSTERLLSAFSPDVIDAMRENVDQLNSFKGNFEAAAPELRKAIGDFEVLATDLNALRSELAPVLSWAMTKMAEEQKGAKPAKPSEPPNDASEQQEPEASRSEEHKDEQLGPNEEADATESA